MTIMRLGDFITSNMEHILQEWDAFATTIVPQALSMDAKALRDHARQMLEAVALDLANPQSALAQEEKSFGKQRLLHGESSAETHAAQRLYSGFSIEQLLSEYRALRASVLKLWAVSAMQGVATDPGDMTRFNEAIDQAIAESVARYSQMVSKSQHLFLAILGHDLRNPLATTLMASRYIIDGGELDDKYVFAANRIHSAGQRMNQLVNDLIDYTRSNLGSSLPIILKDVDMHVLCRDALAEQEAAHPECRFELVVSGDCRGRWDDNRIAQVLSNLLGNAVQYGSPAQAIIMRVACEGEDVQVSVENRGELIPAEKLHTIFDPMVRLAGDNAASSEGNSLGIGLFIAREIVHAHGGSIEVTSASERGTVFAVRLPRNSKGNVAQRWTVPA
jgi:signal transduction histidine kinase